MTGNGRRSPDSAHGRVVDHGRPRESGARGASSRADVWCDLSHPPAPQEGDVVAFLADELRRKSWLVLVSRPNSSARILLKQRRAPGRRRGVPSILAASNATHV